jgi:hypothetical protein
MERQSLVVDDVGEHLPRMVQFGLAVAVRVVQAEVGEPELVELGVDVNASDRTDAFDDGLSACIAIKRRAIL